MAGKYMGAKQLRKAIRKEMKKYKDATEAG